MQKVHKTCDLPILIGSGITLKNIDKYWYLADGFIIGSYFKKDGYWKNSLDKNRINEFILKVKQLQKKN